MTYLRRTQGGFTLLEILLVVAAISILAGIVIVAINPSKQLADTRNAQRRADVNTIINAMYQYALDHNGLTPNELTSGDQNICVTGAASCDSLLDLHVLTDNGTYLTAIPKDPFEATSIDTGYTISKSRTGRLTVSAPHAEQGAAISVTR